MGVLEFFGSVWLAIAVGVFFIAMVIGCSFDRGCIESPKWWIFFIGLIVIAGIAYKTNEPAPFRWDWPFWQPVANTVGLYLLIGLGYSLVEFILEVRRSTRYWTPRWNDFKRSSFSEYKSVYIKAARQKAEEEYRKANPNHTRSSFTTTDTPAFEWDHTKVVVPDQPPLEVMNDFVSRNSTGYDRGRRIIGIQVNDEKTNIEPHIRKSVLAEHVGVWTIFWPFYLVSLIIGDLLVEVFEWIAEAIAGMSGRFVKMAFRNVFKF